MLLDNEIQAVLIKLRLVTFVKLTIYFGEKQKRFFAIEEQTKRLLIQVLGT